MSPGTALVLTYVAAGVVIALYVWFVVWRVRVDRRKKAADTDTATKMTSAIERAAQMAKEMQQAPTPTPSPSPSPSAAMTPPPAPAPAAPETSILTSSKTVAGALSGVALPNDLVPLSTLADRPGAGDRVAFWTDTAPVEIVGPAFAAELERLGFSVTALDEHTLAAQRNDDHLVVVIHPDGPSAIVGDKPGFPSVPERSVVIEVWVA